MDGMDLAARATQPELPAQAPAGIDLEAIKARQQATWASGDFGQIGVRLQIVGESLCEAVDLRATETVLDVAAGNGNASLAAARRFADVTSTDYVPALLEQGRRRAEADRLPITFQVADAEDLPFPDESFDVVLSTFGVMFAPNQERAASELLRVVRPGGRIGLANWTPEGFIGRLFEVMSAFVPPPAGAPLARWRGAPRRGSSSSSVRTPPTSGRAEDVHVPLPLGRALDRVLPHLLRADAQGVRRARRGGPAGAPRRAPRLPRADWNRSSGRRPRHPGRVPRSGGHEVGETWRGPRRRHHLGAPERYTCRRRGLVHAKSGPGHSRARSRAPGRVPSEGLPPRAVAARPGAAQPRRGNERPRTARPDHAGRTGRPRRHRAPAIRRPGRADRCRRPPVGHGCAGPRRDPRPREWPSPTPMPRFARRRPWPSRTWGRRPRRPCQHWRRPWPIATPPSGRPR